MARAELQLQIPQPFVLCSCMPYLSCRGWLIQFTTSGDFVDKVQLGSGRQYHPGGIDTDGEFIYVPVAEYHAGGVWAHMLECCACSADMGQSLSVAFDA